MVTESPRRRGRLYVWILGIALVSAAVCGITVGIGDEPRRAGNPSEATGDEGPSPALEPTEAAEAESVTLPELDIPIREPTEPFEPALGPGTRGVEHASAEQGPCTPAVMAERRKHRDALLQGFIRSPTAGWSFRHDASVALDTRLTLAQWLEEAARRGQRLLGEVAHSKSPPEIVLYRDGEQLRSGTCLSVDSVGYYDGAIHVMADADAGQTLVHEYIHHLLSGRKVPVPEWLEEGLAMTAAQEDWWLAPQLELTQWLRVRPLKFRDLVNELPGREHDGAGGLAYAQSAAMVRFLQHRRPGFDFSALLRGLENGSIPREQAFEHAAGLTGAELLTAWETFVAESL